MKIRLIHLKNSHENITRIEGREIGSEMVKIEEEL
jgi:hypothetical protein